MVLCLLEKGESYGYALIQEIRRLSGERIEWTDGMLYPVLHRMEARGLIKARWAKSETGRKRKYYRLLEEGRTAMAGHHEQWSLVAGVLAALRKEAHV
ncbi:PadR family transcriptional regulator [Luteolibacter soli]|uniref:Helix-turn-helix transcriptional regulator n=1 Tax=Luteolibacter soli TaxID=3135280 RepID=A0ABU9AWG3_9BACT